MSNKFLIKNLKAEINSKNILKGVNLEVNSGEIHAIMGPNGTGKSTLASVIMGNPKYEVTYGQIMLNNKDILKMKVDEKSREGIFLAMQYPSEIDGITNADFLRASLNSRLDKPLSLYEFAKKLENNAKKLKLRDDLPHRYLNMGFSGGEKKRNEILQLLMLKPKIAILDEIDSGLDIDALRIVGNTLTENLKERKNELGIIIITHYQRILDYLKPDYVHVFMDGKIIKTGDIELAKKLENEGYEWIKNNNQKEYAI